MIKQNTEKQRFKSWHEAGSQTSSKTPPHNLTQHQLWFCVHTQGLRLQRAISEASNKKIKADREKKNKKKLLHQSARLITILPQPVILWCVCLGMCLSLWACVQKWIRLQSLSVCLCHPCILLPLQQTRESKWSECALWGRNSMFGLLWTSQPHLETLFLEDRSLSSEANWEMFGGNKQTLQQLDRARTAGEVWTDTVVPQQPPTHQTVCCSSSLFQSDHYDYKSVIGKQPNLQMVWHEKAFKVIMVQCGLTKPHSFHFPHCGLGSVRVWLCQTSFLAGYTVDYLKDWLVLSCAEASAGFLLALDWTEPPTRWLRWVFS